MIKNIIKIPLEGETETNFRQYENIIQNYDKPVFFSLKKYSEYIPFYLIKGVKEGNKRFTYHNIDTVTIKSNFKETGIYYLFNYKQFYSEKLIYSTLLYNLKMSKFIYNYKLNDKISLQINSNYIINSNNEILLCLGYKENKLDFLNDDNFKLFVSTKLLTDSDYSNFYKKIYKDYILLFIQEGIKVEFLTERNLLTTMFNNGVNYDREFNSLTEIEDFFKSKKIESLITFDIQKHKSFIKLEEEVIEEQNGVSVEEIEDIVVEKDSIEEEVEEIFFKD
jgi:hypothetical protein